MQSVFSYCQSFLVVSLPPVVKYRKKEDKTMLNNVITLLSVILPSVVSILTICIPVLLNKQQNKMKELELVYQNKIQAFSEFSEK